jgi:lipopolysaccharide export system protein LptC
MKMRWVAILAVLAIALMFLGGWLYFEDSENQSEIILDKQEVQEDTQQVLDASKEVLKETAEGMKRLGDKAEDALTDEEADNQDGAEIEPVAPQ